MKVNKIALKDLSASTLQSDKGVVAGVCHGRIDLRDSVDDEEGQSRQGLAQVGGMSMEVLAMLFARQNRDQEDHGVLAAGD
jgi:hypothetical protein